jgi:hypothetical protein
MPRQIDPIISVPIAYGKCTAVTLTSHICFFFWQENSQGLQCTIQLEGFFKLKGWIADFVAFVPDHAT